MVGLRQIEEYALSHDQSDRYHARWVKILNLPLAGLQEVDIVNTDNSSSPDLCEGRGTI